MREAREFRFASLAAAALAAAVLLVAAAPAPAALPVPATPAAEHLTPFTSCGALVHYANKHSRGYRPPFTSGGSGGAVPKSKEKGTPENDSTESPSASPQPDSSTTNVQEEGVDEPDIVKNNGNTIFAIGRGALRAIDARAPAPALLDSLKLSGFDQQMLLSGDHLLVISGDFDATSIWDIDVSDPSHMRIVSKQTIDGAYLDARLTGSTVRLAVSFSPLIGVRRKGLRSRLARWVPYVTTRRLGKQRVKPLIDNCGEVSHPYNFAGLDLQTVLTIDMRQGLPAVDTDAVMSDADDFYASQNNLYLTSTQYHYRRHHHRRDYSYPALTTEIHKFDTSNPDETSYVATGSVPGSMLDQFSMSEDKGFLRVASTTINHLGPQTYVPDTRVSVLSQQGDQLALTGQADNIGINQDVYAVRMFGDVGYIVTYHEIDPLHTLDLSDPANPRVAGELLMRGFSTYLHPISDDLLLGVGVDSTPDAEYKGAQISLFNVADPAHPKLVNSQELPGVESEVDFTHHAFLYWEPSKLAVVPVTRFTRRQHFDGALGYQVNPDGLVPAGSLGRAIRRPQAAIERTLVVGGRLFALSCGGLQTASLVGLQQQAFLRFPRAHRGACGFGGYAL